MSVLVTDLTSNFNCLVSTKHVSTGAEHPCMQPCTCAGAGVAMEQQPFRYKRGDSGRVTQWDYLKDKVIQRPLTAQEDFLLEDQIEEVSWNGERTFHNMLHSP